MTIDRQSLYAKLEENSIEKILFSDPLSDTTRKSRRNLLVASVSCLLITILNLKITGFLGLKAETGEIESMLVQGIGSLIVCYYLIVFILYTIVDVSAWNFAKEKSLILGHQQLIELIDNQLSGMLMHIIGFNRKLDSLSTDNEMQDQIHNSETFSALLNYVNATRNDIQRLNDDIRPFITEWNSRVKKTKWINIRFLIRLATLYIFDIMLPIGLSILAIFKSHSGITLAMTTIFS